MATTIRNTAQSAPGVYVYEVSSGSAPILGAGTSTAAFIGVFPDTVLIPEPNPAYKQKAGVMNGFTSVNKSVSELTGQELGEDLSLSIDLLPPGYSMDEQAVDAIVNTGGSVIVDVSINSESKPNDLKDKIVGKNIAYLKDGRDPINFHQGQKIKNEAEGRSIIDAVRNKIIEKNCLVEEIEAILEKKTQLTGKILAQSFQLKPDKKITILIKKDKKLNEEEVTQIVQYSTEAKIKVKESGILPYQNKSFPTDFPFPDGTPTTTITEEVKLCTNFGEFKKFFGDFSKDKGQNILAHAVYGFFKNGGARCYVVRLKGELAKFTDPDAITKALDKFAAIDEIAIVAAPGITHKNCLQAIANYIVQEPVKDWIAVFDSPLDVPDQTKLNPLAADPIVPGKSAYAALYYPWIQVFDPATKLQTPEGDGLKLVPPSGHIAGIYARVDSQRGVHKAPANEPVLGALGLKANITKAEQGELNKNGINCIRNLNGNFLVWGARTLGGDANGEFMYLNVRRLFNYLKKSIDEGTQWTVFEPNSPELWAKIRRNVTSFLMTVWRSGALFGNTPEQAFYVKCDEETNPPELRDRGQVVIEIGVAVVKPAEFVIFNLSQWAGPGK